jgi:hypothetical protein
MRKVLLLSLGLLIITPVIPEWSWAANPVANPMGTGKEESAATMNYGFTAMMAAMNEEFAERNQQAITEAPIFGGGAFFYIFIVLSIVCWFIIVRRKSRAAASKHTQKIRETPALASISRLADLTAREKDFIRRYFG